MRRGDVRAYEALFRTYYRPLCAFAFGFTGSHDTAEDLVQGVFVTLWERRERIGAAVGASNNVRAYLYAAVRNEGLNYRKHHRVVERTHEQFLSGETLPAHGTSPVPPDLSLERDERVTAIRAAVARLPERAREVLTLRWDHALSYDDIGRILGIRPASAKMQQSRALAALRRDLAGIFPETEPETAERHTHRQPT